ncbi:MAG: type II toxin-antitoxin system PemK/MazF family toxin [Thermoanaerobaculia bacterium]
MQRGEIRWYRFSSPDKKRPVLLLTRDSVLEYLGEVTIAPITTTIRDIPSEVLLTPDDGMPRTCAVNLDHLQTVSKDKLGAVITVLPSSRMDEVRSALLFALGFGR